MSVVEQANRRDDVVLDTLDAMCALRRYEDGVPVSLIRMRVWESDRITYDQTHAALTKLVKQGLAIKPRRGFYLSLLEQGGERS